MASQNHNFFHYLITVFYVLVKNVTHSFIWFLVGVIGYLILNSKKAPYDIILGLPLLLIGGGLVVNHLWGVVLSVFYPPYNKGVCVYCSQVAFKDHVKLKEILRH
jgi:hypothetical protein